MEIIVEDKVNPAILETISNQQEMRKVVRWENITVWRSASISVWMLIGLIILIQENLSNKQGQNVTEEEFN